MRPFGGSVGGPNTASGRVEAGAQGRSESGEKKESPSRGEKVEGEWVLAMTEHWSVCVFTKADHRPPTHRSTCATPDGARPRGARPRARQVVTVEESHPDGFYRVETTHHSHGWVPHDALRLAQGGTVVHDYAKAAEDDLELGVGELVFALQARRRRRAAVFVVFIAR